MSNECCVMDRTLKYAYYPKMWDRFSPCEQCMCFLCVHLRSEPVVFLGVAVDGHAAVVGDGPRHGRYAHDNSCRWVVTQDGVRGFAVFSSAAKNEDLPVAHGHATALL